MLYNDFLKAVFSCNVVLVVRLCLVLLALFTLAVTGSIILLEERSATSVKVSLNYWTARRQQKSSIHRPRCQFHVGNQNYLGQGLALNLVQYRVTFNFCSRWLENQLLLRRFESYVPRYTMPMKVFSIECELLIINMKYVFRNLLHS